MSKRRQRVRGNELDAGAFLRVGRPDGHVLIEGEYVHQVMPVRPLGDPKDFDRAVCAAGLKRYVRPRAPSDWPAGFDDASTHVLVREGAPGVRMRTGLVLYPAAMMN